MKQARIPFSAYWRLIARHVSPQKARFWGLVALLLGSIGLQLVNPQIVRAFIDAATTSTLTTGPRDNRLLLAAVAYIGIALVQQGVSIAATYMGESVAWTATNALRSELTQHCLHLDMGFHNEHKPGELIERIDGDVTTLATFFSQVIVKVIGNLLLLIGILVAVYLENLVIGAVFTVFATAALWIMNRLQTVAVPHYKAERQASADLFGFLEEHLAGTEDIRSSGAIGFVMRELYRLQYAILGYARKAALAGMSISVATGALLMLGTVITAIAGYHLHRSGVLTIGAVYMLINYLNLLSRPIRELTRQVEGLQTIGASVERLTELLQIETRISDGPGVEVLPGPLALTFDQVSFSYAAEPVLDSVSFVLKPGQVLGLLGRTGSGKTTLARLAVRLYDPTSGRVTLNGIDIRQPRLPELRQRIAIVTQDVQLFQASVRDNLTFFDAPGPEARAGADVSAGPTHDDQIHRVIQELELADWFAALSNGLDTRLETGGRSLSAGEAQLLAFTRVFLRDPGLIILDEASSRLDPATEARIERAIDRLLVGRTAIVIAHRLHTVMRADQILILEDGHVREYGDRAQLARDPTSRFYHLLQTGLEEVLA
jgi:ATP-binding cassette subfamily B protein